MSPRTAVTATLLLVVAASVAAFVIREVRRTAPAALVAASAIPPSANEPGPSPEGTSASAPPPGESGATVGGPPPVPPLAAAAAPTPSAARTGAAAPRPQPPPLPVVASPPADRIVAIYFHGNRRCRTCRLLESLGETAVREAFAAELRDGLLEWKTINFDLPGNEHFLQDYGLSFQSIVLQEIRGGKPGGWKNLEKIWDLVADEQAYTRYVQEEVRARLEAL